MRYFLFACLAYLASAFLGFTLAFDIAPLAWFIGTFGGVIAGALLLMAAREA